MLKTYENWNCSLSEYLQVGDIVDEEMVNHFLGVLPPITFTSRLIQMGEPADHVNGRATYMTIERTSEGWAYCGECHRGEAVKPVQGEYKEDNGLYSITFIPETACLALYNGEELKDHRFFSKYAYENKMFDRQDMEQQSSILASENGVQCYALDLSQF